MLPHLKHKTIQFGNSFIFLLTSRQIYFRVLCVYFLQGIVLGTFCMLFLVFPMTLDMGTLGDLETLECIM